MRAKFVKTVTVTAENVRFLWKVHGTMAGATFSTHVVTSSATWGSFNETVAFWADENGRVLDWSGINWVAGPHHVECLLDAGFEVIGLE